MSNEAPCDGSAGPTEQQRITEAVQAIAERRALIEQAKGMLMFVYGMDADAAFDILRTKSQQLNVKLRLVAEQILEDLLELSRTRGPARLNSVDGLLLSAHQRIAHGAGRSLGGKSRTDSMKAL